MAAKQLHPISPGEILYGEFMKPLGVSINDLRVARRTTWPKVESRTRTRRLNV